MVEDVSGDVDDGDADQQARIEPALEVEKVSKESEDATMEVEEEEEERVPEFIYDQVGCCAARWKSEAVGADCVLTADGRAGEDDAAAGGAGDGQDGALERGRAARRAAGAQSHRVRAPQRVRPVGAHGGKLCAEYRAWKLGELKSGWRADGCGGCCCAGCGDTRRDPRGVSEAGGMVGDTEDVVPTWTGLEMLCRHWRRCTDAWAAARWT